MKRKSPYLQVHPKPATAVALAFLGGGVEGVADLEATLKVKDGVGRCAFPVPRFPHQQQAAFLVREIDNCCEQHDFTIIITTTSEHVYSIIAIPLKLIIKKTMCRR
jgi:hypothetical protein